MNNQAFIDGQNLIKGTTNDTKPWRIDLIKFRIFLKEKYQVKHAYYFIGVKEPKFDKMYKFIEKAGFKLVFREHDSKGISKKKGNVDTDIVFTIMDEVFRKNEKGKIVLVSGDGDYYKMVNRLIIERKFRAIMFPNKRWSALYNKLNDRFKVRLYTREVRKYLKLK
ncbi:MAG: NYN domain-containing protein [Candidatus Nomurabacteria bacterium]|jgi:uncharacterized LabA/DUF88 family protein|nr:NYN domain-containing protein [Candidatus Nomurabacteria bacterium]